MKLPSSLKIAGYTVKVLMDKKSLDKDNANGSYYEQEIRINPEISEQEQRAILIHEILECLVSVYRIQSLSDHHGDLAILADGIFAVLQDNPGLLSAPVQAKRKVS